MSDEKKATLKQAKVALINAGLGAVKSTVPNAVGLPGGTQVVTNASTNARFPLPLTIGSAVLGAIGVLMYMRGHRIIGAGMVGLAIVGIGAAAAAPELTVKLQALKGIGQ